MDKIIKVSKEIITGTKNSLESFMFQCREDNRLPTTDFKLIDVSSEHDTIKQIGEDIFYVIKENLNKDDNTALYIEQKTIIKYFNICFDQTFDLYEKKIVSYHTADELENMIHVALMIYKSNDINKDFLMDDVFENIIDKFISILNQLEIKSIISLIPLSTVDN